MINTKEQKRVRRHARVRRAIATKNPRPRLCIHRSNRYISGQVIDDEKGHTLAAASSKGLSGANFTERAHAAGKAVAEAAKAQGISEVVFDRGGYRYMGRVKAFAEGAREGGLVF